MSYKYGICGDKLVINRNIQTNREYIKKKRELYFVRCLCIYLYVQKVIGSYRNQSFRVRKSFEFLNVMLYNTTHIYRKLSNNILFMCVYAFSYILRLFVFFWLFVCLCFLVFHVFCMDLFIGVQRSGSSGTVNQ